MVKKWQAIPPRKSPFYRRREVLGGLAALALIIGLGFYTRGGLGQRRQSGIQTPAIHGSPISEKKTEDVPQPPAALPSAPVPAKTPLIFGVGTELDHDLNHRITKEAPLKMLTSWYNGPNDLAFMSTWRTTTVPVAYASGYALHLIIYNDDPETNLQTAYGPACGRPYPLSARFLADMQQLAQIFRGGQLYVSMFTELQTYPCADNTWAEGQNYYRALKDQYRAAMNSFHLLAPGSQVSLSWGGWQANWDDTGRGGGLSLFNHFADVMNASDFQSFQAMDNVDNVSIINNMTKALQPYTGGTMIAHYKPDNRSQGTFDADIKNIFTPGNIATWQQQGLFAFSFMDTSNMNSSEAAFQSVKHVIQKYGQ